MTQKKPSTPTSRIFEDQLRAIKERGWKDGYQDAITALSRITEKDVNPDQRFAIMVGLWKRRISPDQLTEALALMQGDTDFRDRTRYRSPLMAADFIEMLDYVPVPGRKYTPQQKAEIERKYGETLDGEFQRVAGESSDNPKYRFNRPDTDHEQASQ